MNNIFNKIDKIVRDKFPVVSYAVIWDKIWEETAKFLQANLDETDTRELMIKLRTDKSREANLKILLEKTDKIEMGRIRLTERLNYILDNLSK